jgi:hypothetical protein
MCYTQYSTYRQKATENLPIKGAKTMKLREFLDLTAKESYMGIEINVRRTKGGEHFFSFAHYGDSEKPNTDVSLKEELEREVDQVYTTFGKRGIVRLGCDCH